MRRFLAGFAPTDMQRWGNCLALQIPKQVADDLGLSGNDAVELTVVDGRLIVAPAPCPKLDDLIAPINDDNRHGARRVG